MHHNWQAYRVLLRLHTPLHIGAGRVSYLQRTRPYVTGRALRGALVTRLARSHPHLLSQDPLDPYRRVSKTLAAYLAFTYFYPALKKDNGDWEAFFPWGDCQDVSDRNGEDEASFRRRFLSSYTAAALDYPSQTAAESLLYETEFIAPYTLDDGKPVYLMGYIFVDEMHLKRERYDWVSALERLQLGGERSYGWGEARLAENGIQKISSSDRLFDNIYFELEEKRRPVVSLQKNQPVLAHTHATGVGIAGNIEPMVGREWRADNQKKCQKQEIYIGQHLRYDGIWFAPGSCVTSPASFSIEEGGYWYPVKEKSS